MFQKKTVAEISHGKRAYAQYIKNEFLDESGLAVINVNLDNDISLYNPLSFGVQRELNGEIVSYIDEKIEYIDPNTPICIVFSGRAVDESEQTLAEELLREHFSLKLFTIRNRLRENGKKCILLTLLGIAMLTLYFTLDYAIENGIKTEIISIIASFSLWEAVDLFILERREMLHELRCRIREQSCIIQWKEKQ